MEKIITSSVLSFPKVLKFLAKLPTKIVTLCDQGEAIIVGGAFRSIFSGEEPNDVDIFIKNRQTFLDIVKEFGATLDEQTNGAQCRAGEVFLDIQWTLGFPLIDVVNLSDLTIAQVAYSQRNLFYNENFFSHVRDKKFSLTNNILDPKRTKERIKKYQGYGFTYLAE